MFKGNLGDIIRQAQQMGETLKTKQDEMARHRFEVSVGGGMVKMTFNGKGQALSITIDPEIVDPGDINTLHDLVLSAVNEGIKQSQQAMQEEMSRLAGGLKIPGLTA